MRGIVKFFNEIKGFGFIGIDGEEDLFVHYKSIKVSGFKKLVKDQKVEFDIEIAEDGRKRAKNVRIVD